MAYLYEEEEEEEVQQPAAGSALIGAGGMATGETTGPQQERASGFVNVGEYLEANKPQAQAMGSKLTESYRQQAERLRGRADAAQAGFQSQREEATPEYKSGLISGVAEKATGLGEEKTQEVKGQLGAAYRGPQSLQQTQAYQPLQQDVKSFTGDIQSFLKPGESGLGTAAGRERLAQKISPQQVSGGARALNELLLSRTPGVLGGIRSQMTEAQGIGDYLKGLEDKSRLEAQASREQAEDVRKKSAEALRGSTGMEGIRDRVKERVDRMKAERAATEPDLQAFLGGTLRDDDSKEAQFSKYMEALGITPEQYDELQAIRARIADPSSVYEDVGADIAGAERTGEDLASRFFQYSTPGEIRSETAITAEESAQMQALANLLGESALVGEKTGDVDPYFEFRPEVKEGEEGEEGEEGKMDFEDIMSYLEGIEGQQADRAEHLRAQIAAQQTIDTIIPPPGSPGHKPNPTLAELGAQLNELQAQMEIWQGYDDIQAQLAQTIQQYHNMGPQPDGAGGWIPGELTEQEVAMGIADAEQAYGEQLPSGWDAFSQALGFGTAAIQEAMDQVSSQISAQTPTPPSKPKPMPGSTGHKPTTITHSDVKPAADAPPGRKR
tara:strand:- start:20662 stop:22497 length:1836 start_codon:yes stop_codon:yes gene_type:complete